MDFNTPFNNIQFSKLFPMQPQDPNAAPQDLSGAFQSSTDVSAPAPAPPINVQQRYNDLYHPDTAATSAYAQQLQQVPNRDDPRYRAGGFRRVLAGIAGAGAKSGADAFTTSRGIVNAPYDQDLSDWEAKTKAFGEGSRLEEMGNNQKREIVGKQIDQEITAAKEKDIFNTKVADMERKIHDAEVKASQFEQQYRLNQGNATARENYWQAQSAAKELAHQLDVLKLQETIHDHERKADEFNRTILQKEEQMRAMQDYNKAKLAGQSVENFIINPDGTVQYRTVSNKGPSADRVAVTDENGKNGTVTKGGLEDWLKANPKRKKRQEQMSQ